MEKNIKYLSIILKANFFVINMDIYIYVCIYIYIYMMSYVCIKHIAENLNCLSDICNINKNKSACYFTWLLFYCTLFQSKNIQTHTGTHIHYFYFTAPCFSLRTFRHIQELTYITFILKGTFNIYSNIHHVF
jgi:hypothetical protein